STSCPVHSARAKRRGLGAPAAGNSVHVPSVGLNTAPSAKSTPERVDAPPKMTMRPPIATAAAPKRGDNGLAGKGDQVPVAALYTAPSFSVVPVEVSPPHM